MTPIDLDRNATAPLRTEAAEAMRRAQAEPLGNPASAHSAGRRARRLLEDARERIAVLLGAKPAEVVFTSGATEANNLALFGLVEGRIAAAPFEHPCVMEPLRVLAERGTPIDWIPVDSQGFVKAEDFPVNATFAVLMLANHETGAIQPVRALARRMPVHTDAAQAVGKIPVNFGELSVRTLAASAHKFGGPPGVGVLLVREGVKLKPLHHGGHQQRGLRPGTEPVVLAVGMAAALEAAIDGMGEALERMRILRARFLVGFRGCAFHLNGPALDDPRGLPSTVNISFPGCRAELLLMALDLAGVQCSAGSACSSGSLLPSPVLRAMGVPEDRLESAIRFSFGADQTEDEMDEAARRVVQAVTAMR